MQAIWTDREWGTCCNRSYRHRGGLDFPPGTRLRDVLDCHSLTWPRQDASGGCCPTGLFPPPFNGFRRFSMNWRGHWPAEQDQPSIWSRACARAWKAVDPSPLRCVDRTSQRREDHGERGRFGGYDAAKIDQRRKAAYMTDYTRADVATVVHSRRASRIADAAPMVIEADPRSYSMAAFMSSAIGGYAGPQTAQGRLPAWAILEHREFVKTIQYRQRLRWCLPRRWVVGAEHSPGLGRCRPPRKRTGRKPSMSATAWLTVAHIRIVTRRLRKDTA